MLMLYNSLTRQKERFKPLVPHHIGLYVCGITVYDHCHLGHARSMVCFDAMVRFLRSIGYTVKYVRNITDIDDKIIIRAQERKVPIQTLTAQYIESMHADMAALKVLPPDEEPRATSHIETIIRLIERLLSKGHAYIAGNGDVCYEVATFDTYGRLSHKDLEGLLSGARVEVVKEKRSPLDFVLWKKAKPGEPSWISPWGEGRPGWHIECSAMAMEELGEHFDIHGGGLDLQFPHHENEIAQSEGATENPFANYWLHVGMLQVDNEKMAKSAGNFFTIAELLEKEHPEVLRYFLLSSHYRSPLNYTDVHLQQSRKALTRFYQALKGVKIQTQLVDKTWVDRFNAAMNDDFNTPAALSVLFDLCHEFNKTTAPGLACTLTYLGGILGLLQEEPAQFLQAGVSTLSEEAILALISEREAARQEREWAKADAIRNQLLKKGIELEDSTGGTTWRVVV